MQIEMLTAIKSIYNISISRRAVSQNSSLQTLPVIDTRLGGSIMFISQKQDSCQK